MTEIRNNALYATVPIEEGAYIEVARVLMLEEEWLETSYALQEFLWYGQFGTNKMPTDFTGAKQTRYING